MTNLYDVAIVGYGPAGEVLASTLGAAGLKVAVVERWPEPYPLPRLTSLGGDICRIVQATGKNLEAAFEQTLVLEKASFVDADGVPLIEPRYPGGAGGWPARLSMYQPDVERGIADKVAEMPNVEMLRGWEGADLWQDSDSVHLYIVPTERGDGVKGLRPRTLRAKYLVGTDGARSFVRQMLALGMRDFDMHQRWVNFDAVNLKPLSEKFLDLKIFMDPERPYMWMPIGKRGLRMEYRVADDETDEYVTQPGVVEEFMTRKLGLDPQDFRIMRRVVYHYRTRMAEQWRVGRAFIAGDAAHTMPPFMGEGACSAMRDGRNLAWKLIEVLSGRSSDALLDEYMVEREPHVSFILHASDMLSRLVNVTDPQAAESRNAEIRARDKPHSPPDLQALVAGVLHREPDGSVAAPTGVFAPQGRLRQGTAEALGDDLLGSGFQLWSLKDPRHELQAEQWSLLERMGCAVAVFDDASSPYAVEDLDGVYRKFLLDHGVQSVIVRPDFYVFGAATGGHLGALVLELAQRLHSNLAEQAGASTRTQEGKP